MDTVADDYWDYLDRRDALNAVYRVTLEALDAECKAQRRALYNAHREEQAALQAYYRARLAPNRSPSQKASGFVPFS